jgi:hypothetical protein
VGSLTLPASGLVYIDANPIIYTVEKHPVYGPLLVPLWQAAQAQTIEVVSSELALMETLVGPLKRGDAALEKASWTTCSNRDGSDNDPLRPPARRLRQSRENDLP